MKEHFNLIGVGIGPFHLSLAALLEKAPEVNHLFLDQRSHFEWHPELLFSDAEMQTSFYKDLVTPIDPTNRHSYLNYLVENGLFYAFMNTGRKTITRKEFEIYGQWVSKRMKNLEFNSPVESINFEGNKFVIKTDKTQFTSDHLSIATGLSPRTPECAKSFIGANVFHAKSGRLQNLDLTGKRVLIVGGGQTGVEILRNALKNKWGKAQEVTLVSRRKNLEPLDESPFTNEYFTPAYADDFFNLESARKAEIVLNQKLASDGNTPTYLQYLYNDLYFLKHVEKDVMPIRILPKRTMIKMSQISSGGYETVFKNSFLDEEEVIKADIVILSTGFLASLPKALDNIKHLLELDQEEKLHINKNFDLKWKGSTANKIYALNFGRHSHGISEPQTSLMAWRSAVIINDLTGKNVYQASKTVPNFLQYGKGQN